MTETLKTSQGVCPPVRLQVLLGNGFYNEQGKRYAKMKISFGPPTLLFRLHIDYEDGTTDDVVSDASWQWALSPITFNSIYGGEDYDARLEPSPSPFQQEGSWKAVVVQEAPKGVLRPQIAQPVKIMERYAVKDTVHKDSVLVLDMGQNLAGFPEITVQGKAGQWLKLTPGETLTPEGLVNQKQTGRPHYYTYILKGSLPPNVPTSSARFDLQVKECSTFNVRGLAPEVLLLRLPLPADRGRHGRAEEGRVVLCL